MAHKPSWVANSFLARAREGGVKDVDHLKIQKLVYCLHGWTLATRNEPAVGEFFEAWPYGPVLSSLYHAFKKHGRKPIKTYAADVDPASGEVKAFRVGDEDNEFHEVFDEVWKKYKGLTGLQLSQLTHADGTPWWHARQRGDDYLDNADIRKHFVDLARQGREQAHESK